MSSLQLELKHFAVTVVLICPLAALPGPFLFVTSFIPPIICSPGCLFFFFFACLFLSELREL